MDYNWTLINSFAPWFSAVGTISAVIVALYLSRKDRPKLKVKADIQILISNEIKDRPRYLTIEIVNIGVRPIKVVSVGWTIGLFKKQSYIQILTKDNTDILANLYSSNLPIKLNEGDEAKWLIPLDKEDNWVDMFKENLSFFTRWDLRFTRLVVYTSHGISFKTAIGDGLKKELLKAAESK